MYLSKGLGALSVLTH